MPNGQDKNWVRLCAAVDGYQLRYGRWPTRVRISEGIMDNLEQLFPGSQLACIRGKVMFVIDGSPIIAEGEDGSQYSYGDEGFPDERPVTRAYDWLRE